MKVLFVTKDGMAVDLARQIKKRGHDVKLFIGDLRLSSVYDGIIEKTSDWKNELDWVGKTGLIIFDDNGYGAEQEKLRASGYSVFGGNIIADKLEFDREFSSRVFKKYKIKTNSLKTFHNPREAIYYVKENPARYIIKRNGADSKFITYVGNHPDGKDALEVLEKYCQDPILKDQIVSVQIKAEGVEIGVGRYFNGKKWVGPIEINVEHPFLFPGDIGPMTDEMGTVAWFTEKHNRLYEETLEKLLPFLKEIDYRGDIGINTIINEKEISALEMTPRLGCPIIHLHTTLQKSDWAEFLKSVADGKDYDLKYKRGYGVVISVCVPPFPFQKHFQTDICSEITVDMSGLSQKDKEFIHLDEVMYDEMSQDYKTSRQTNGFIMYVTGHDKKSINRAKNNALKIVRKISLPKMFYRIDIGDQFSKKQRKRLEEWGWL